MKIPQILKAIEQIDGWYLTDLGKIRKPGRFKYYEECPLTALGNQSLTWANEVANQFDISTEDSLAIIKASDYQENTELRKQLLKATRLDKQ